MSEKAVSISRRRGFARLMPFTHVRLQGGLATPEAFQQRRRQENMFKTAVVTFLVASLSGANALRSPLRQPRGARTSLSMAAADGKHDV
eukprot:scaffold438_cov250-Pinguiococcus_pyrenoidosus.AAC.33